MVFCTLFSFRVIPGGGSFCRANNSFCSLFCWGERAFITITHLKTLHKSRHGDNQIAGANDVRV